MLSTNLNTITLRHWLFPLHNYSLNIGKPDHIEVDVIVPVPLHSHRLRERGYNQAGLLAQELGRLINLPVVEDSLFRLQDTPAQVKAPNAEIRRKNVLGAFACRKGRA